MQWLKAILDFFSKLFTENRERMRRIDAVMTDVTQISQKLEDGVTGLRREIEGYNIATDKRFSAFEKDFREFEGRFDSLNEHFDDLSSRMTYVSEGLQQEMLKSMMQIHDRYMAQGYSTPDQKIYFQTFYNRYHKLAENGVADVLLEDVNRLPSAGKEKNGIS